MRNLYYHLISGAAALALASLLALHSTSTAIAAGVVTDCTTFGPGPGTLAAAVATDGLVTFACSGVIVLPAQIPMFNDRHLVIDGTGQSVTLSGGNNTRLFNLGSGSSLHLHRMTITGGKASGGGAIQSAGYLTITNSALISNTADYGGALELFNGSAWIENSTLAGNRAIGSAQTDGGGAINQYFVDQGDGNRSNRTPYVEIVNSTIAGNSSVVAGRGGIWQENGKLIIRYSIVARNSGGNCLIDPPNLSDQFATIGSLDDDGACLAERRADPLLAPLGYDDGTTPGMTLLPNSPAIDAAPPATCARSVDQRNALRPRDGNHDGAVACDLGAYEYGGRFMVAAAAADGLAGYWKLDEGSGSVVMDSSGNGLAGTLFGSAAFTPDHPTLAFNTPFALQSAPGGGIQVPDAALLNPAGELTVAAWVRLNGVAGVQPVAARLAGENGPGYGLLIRDGFLSAEAWDSTGVRRVITGEVAVGGWLHVAMTYRQAGEMAAYVNGRQVGVQTTAGVLAPSTGPLLMAVDGAIDDVRIYNRALPSAAVAALAGGRNCVTSGTTWADAMPDLQCALFDAAPGAEIWLAPGIYRPTFGPDRTATFAIGDGVGVFGGFAGSETRREERTSLTPLPVFSGDITADDLVDSSGVLTDLAGLVGGNALHVVSISSTLTSTVLEQVVVSGGMADGARGQTCGPACGGGLYIAGGAPQLTGLWLVGNQAASSGGALYAEQSSTLVISATLQANRAGSGGGAFWQGAAPVLINGLIAGNQAEQEGGGLYSLDSALRLVNASVAANYAGARGGGLLLNGGGATASNIVVGANAAPVEPQFGGGGAAVAASLVQGGCPAAITCGGGVLAVDPLFVDPASAGAPSSLGDYHLLPASPAIDSGDNEASLAPGAPAGATVASISADLAGASRIMAARSQPPRIDLGAYEAPNTPPLFTTEPPTKGATMTEYLYQAVAIDPNLPAQRLPIELVRRPEWLRLEAQADGSALLHGTPPDGWYGYFDVVLRSTDTLGAVTEQAFTINVVQRVYTLYLPGVLR